MSSGQCGGILEEKCTFHKQIVWTFKYVLPHTKEHFTLTSPEFEIGSQNYKLELSSDSSSWTNLLLYRRGPFVDGPSRYVRWWAGLKRKDGTYNDRNLKGELELNKCETWTQITLHRISQYELQDHILQNNLIVFFRLSMERAHATTQECTHGAAKMSAMGTGTIREGEECTSHKHVEWEILFGRLREGKNLMSPSFMIGKRTFKLELSFGYGKPDSRTIHIHLYSKETPTASPSRPSRWWAGMKLHIDTNVPGIHGRGTLDLKKECEIWTQKNLYTVNQYKLVGINQMDLVYVFFRLNFERATKVPEMCNHGQTEMSVARCEGTIQEVECDFYKQMEWHVISPCNPSFRSWTSSPEFRISTQQFKFEVYMKHVAEALPQLLCLNLYSKGYSIGEPSQSLRWCAGLQRPDGTYHHKILRGELDLKEKYELWTPRGFINFSLGNFEFSPVTFFFRLQKETAPTAEKTCNVDATERSATGFGEIRKQVFTYFEQVVWTTDYDDLREKNLNFSPEFSIGNQRYILELLQDSNALDSMTLCLYRRGSSVAEPPRFAQWWAGLKRGNGTHHHRNQRGELNLNEECELWTPIYLHRVCRYELERELLAPDNTFTAFFRLSVERPAMACTYDDKESLPQSKRKRSEDSSDVVFQVKDVEFKMPRDIVEARIPVYKAMFKYDTIENASGVVTIKDFEPTIFKEFLHYISTGFLSEITVSKADLYMVADKYLIDDLKAECLQYLTENLSADNFCDVVTLALRHKENDLLKEATDFLSQNKSITTTEGWKKMCSENPTETKYLLLKAFLPEERT